MNFGDTSWYKRKPYVVGTVTQPVPTTAPPGSYDPSLDYAKDSANLGYLFNTQDYATGQQRLAGDYGINSANLDTQHNYTLADLLLAKQREGEDFSRQSGYANQDYGRTTGRLNQDYANSTADLIRSFQNLADQQNGGIRAAGAGEGGAAQQAADKRGANQGHEQGYLDLGHNRGMEDASTNYNRLLESLNSQNARFLQDNATATDRANAGYAADKAALDLGFSRGSQDLTTTYQRQGLSNTLYQQQVGQQQIQQAQSSGALAPPVSYKVEYFNGHTWHVYPNGRKVPVK